MNGSRWPALPLEGAHILTLDQFLACLRDASDRAGTQHALARQLGVSQALVSQVLGGKRLPTPKLLRACGLHGITRYATAAGAVISGDAG